MPTIVRATTRCQRCQAPLAFVRTERGRAMPIDPTPTPGGNLAVHKDMHGSVVARVVTDELPAAPWETVYTPHFATCTPPTLFDPPPGGNVIPHPTLKRRTPRAHHTPDH